MITQPVRQLDFLGVEKRRRELSSEGDPLEVLARVIPWESFRRGLDAALGRDKVTTGRPPFDVVKMLKILELQHLYNLSDFQASYQLRDRISWQRFVGIELGATVPDEKTIWAFRERLIQVDAIEETSAIPGDQIDAALQVAVPDRNESEHMQGVKMGRLRPEDLDTQGGCGNHLILLE